MKGSRLWVQNKGQLVLELEESESYQTPNDPPDPDALQDLNQDF